MQKLKVLWEENTIKDYEAKLDSLIVQFIFEKTKGEKNKETKELQAKASALIPKIENELKGKSNVKEKALIIKEIKKFIDLKKIDKEQFDILENKVISFIEFNKEKREIHKDSLEWPVRKNSKTNNLSYVNKLYELIFWYSDTERSFDDLVNPDLKYKDYLRISMRLNSQDDIRHIVNFINEKKLEVVGEENPNISNDDKKKIKNMLRSVFLLKFMKTE